MAVISPSGQTERPPFWNLNLPQAQWTKECPVFLQGLPQKDMDVLTLTDDEFRAKRLVMDWADVKETINTQRINRFKRLPSHLRRYKAFRFELNGTHGGVMPFVLQTRLWWKQPVMARGAPFQFDDDYKILYNDWPYEVGSDIVHLVVWTKFTLDEDPETTLLSDRAHAQVEEFVTKTFRARLPDGHVIWWRNTADLKSVHALEHFHVMLYRPDRDFLRKITNGDIPEVLRIDPRIEVNPVGIDT